MRTLVTLAAAAATALSPAAATAAPDPVTTHANSAVAYAAHRHVTSSIAVLDTRTGRTWTGGARTRQYAAASTAKVFTAVAILVRHKMTERNRKDMWAMITRSDNAAWHRLGVQVGGARTLTTVEHRYHLDIGSLPRRVTNWGATRVTALGMARMYAAIERDPVVWPWLHRAMAHIAPHSSGGDYQLFGIPAAHPVGGYALKQGWVVEAHDGRRPYAVVNSTGYVGHYRYVVCIYTRGTPAMYEHVAKGVLGRTISGEARRLLPRGRVE